jgi:phosphate-selective porin OprO and OprP
MRKIHLRWLALLWGVAALWGQPVHAQEVPEVPYFTFGKGLGIGSPDSLYLLNIRFRVQNRWGMTSMSDTDLRLDEVEARVRRLRLRFDGFVYDRRLTYVIQLSFTRGDMDFDVLGVPNVVRDAMVFWAVSDRLTIGLGQTKLPGNRQRVNSSGDLQLVDRSIVNAFFNIDRDFGGQIYYNNKIGQGVYVLRGALTSGEGRNSNSSDRGLAYTGRLEWLPLGWFTGGGDYFEGDLLRESTPKLSLASSYSSNRNSVRTGGQLGRFLYVSRDINTFMADALFKYRGYAFAAEWIQRSAPEGPVTENADGDVRYVYAGRGQTYQSSYLFHNNLEVIGRFSQVVPSRDIRVYEPQTTHYTLGLTRYLRGHRVKLQTDLTYEINRYQEIPADIRNWQLRFQVEMGI